MYAKRRSKSLDTNRNSGSSSTHTYMLMHSTLRFFHADNVVPFINKIWTKYYHSFCGHTEHRNAGDCRIACRSVKRPPKQRNSSHFSSLPFPGFVLLPRLFSLPSLFFPSLFFSSFSLSFLFSFLH